MPHVGLQISHVTGHASVAGLPSTPINLWHLLAFIFSQPFPLSSSFHLSSSTQMFSSVGPIVGPIVGPTVGSGVVVGNIVMLGLIVGEFVGEIVGEEVGFAVGCGVQTPQVTGHPSVASLPPLSINWLHLLGFILSQPFPLSRSTHVGSSSQTYACVGPADGDVVGNDDGEFEIVGPKVGDVVGYDVGEIDMVGPKVGLAVGFMDGALDNVGPTVGDVVGCVVGPFVGDVVGEVVGGATLVIQPSFRLSRKPLIDSPLKYRSEAEFDGYMI